jgi:hypothetical protein
MVGGWAVLIVKSVNAPYMEIPPVFSNFTHFLSGGDIHGFRARNHVIGIFDIEENFVLTN